MKKNLIWGGLPLILIYFCSATYAEQSNNQILSAKNAVIHCVHQTYPRIKQVDPSNPCSEGTDCFFAWQLEQHCGELLTKNFPNCFFSVSTVTAVKCLEKGQIAYRDKNRWNPNNKFRSAYTLIDYTHLE